MVEQFGRAAAAAPADPAPPSGWLTQEQQEAWHNLSALFLLLPGVLDAQLQRDAGLNLFEYLVLSALSMRDDWSMRMSELAEFTNGSLSRLSNVAKRLEQRGWMTRQPDPENGRFTRAVLTDAGWDAVAAAAPGHVEAVRQYVVEPLTTTQLRALAVAGERVRAKVASEGRCPPPETACPPPDCAAPGC